MLHSLSLLQKKGPPTEEQERGEKCVGACLSESQMFKTTAAFGLQL